MTSRNVLVLCHRKPKQEKNTYPFSQVPDTSIQTIEKYVASLYPGDKIHIEYMAYGFDNGFSDLAHNGFGEVDYQIKLSRNPNALEFVKDHLGQYDTILLNNCLIGEISYDLVHQLLKPNGLMVIKAIKRLEEWPVSLDDDQFSRPAENTYDRVREVLDTYFTYDKYKRIFHKKQVVPLGMIDTLRKKIRDNRRSFTYYKRWGGKKTRRRRSKK